MEDKLSSKESHVWTLSDFIERRKDWDQRDEARLAEYLQQLSNKITQGAKNTLKELDDLVATIDDTAIQAANINNEFQLLADKQFIENKVQEEDETVQLKIEKPVTHELNEADVLLVNNIKEALKNSFKAVDNHFEKITVVVSDSDDDELKHEETILRPKIFYKKLNLPSVSGNIQSEISIDNTLSSDSDVEPPMDTFKKQESFSSDDVPEENVPKSTIEPNHQTVDSYSNIIEPEKLKHTNISPDIVYDENDLFSPPPLLNDNDEDDLVNEYNIFSNGSNMFGERNLWDDPDDDDDGTNFEPPLPVYTEEPPQQVFKSNTQEKVSNIQQTLNDELRKRFQKDNMSSSSDNASIESPKLKLPVGAVNVLFGTDSKNAAQNIKQATISQISKNIAEPTQYNTVSDDRKDIDTSNKLLGDSSQNIETFTHKDLKEEIKTIKKQSLFEQDSDDEDLFAEKIPNVISVLKTDEPKQQENSVKNIKETNTIFSEIDEKCMSSKLVTKEVVTNFVDNKSTTLLDSSSDDDLFNIKSNNKSVLKQKFNQVEHKSQSHLEEKRNKEILNKEIISESKNNYIESNVVTAYNKIIEKESIRNNNTLGINTAVSSMDNKSKKLSYLFSSDENDDIFFDVDESNDNKKKTGQPISSSTKTVKHRNEKRYGSKVELFDSSSDDEIFNINKSNNNFNFKKNNKPSLSIDVKSTNISKLPIDHDTINQMQETKNTGRKNLIEKKPIEKKHNSVFSLESDDDDDNDDYLSHNASISDESKILSNIQNKNHDMNSMSMSSEEYLTPMVEPQYKDIFNDFSAENILNSKNHKSFNEKKMDTPQNETLPSYIGNTTEENTSIFSSSDDEQQLSFNSTIHNVNPSSEIKVIQSNLNSLSENLPIINNEKPSNEKEISTSKSEISSTSENIIQDKKSSILSSSDDIQQLSFNSNILNKLSDTEIKLISPTLESLPANSSTIENLESLNEKEINTAKNETSSSFTENKILDRKSSIFSSSEDEQQLSSNSNNQNKKTNPTNKVIQPTSDSKISLRDSIDGSSFSSQNSKNENQKKIPGKLSVNAGAFINVASLLPNSKNPLIKSKISPSVVSDEKITDTLPTSGTKLYSAEKERARIPIKRRPPSRKARQLAISKMSSVDIYNAQESNYEDFSHLNVSTSLEKDFVDYKSSPILQEDNLEVQNKTQRLSNSKLFVANEEKLNVKEEINNEVKKKSTLDLFDDDSDPFETETEDTKSEDFIDENIKIKIGQHSDIVVNEEQPIIESENKKSIKNESKQDKLTLNVEEIEGNSSKLVPQSTILSIKSNSLFDDEEDLFSVKSEKAIKPSSNIFDSDDEFEFNHKFTKKNPVETKSIFGDDSDDDLFNTPSKSATGSLFNRKQIGNLSQQQNRSGTDGYVKLTAESVAINPLDESKND